MADAKNRRRKCLLSFALLLLILGLAVAAVLVPWWFRMQYYDENAARLVNQLMRFQALSARRPLLESRLKQVNQQRKANGYYIQADTPAVAAALLQRKVKQEVKSSGGKLVSTQSLPSGSTEKPAKIAVRVRMTGDIDALAKVLHKLEGGRPLLFVDNLSIRSRKKVRGRRSKRLIEYHLDVRFDLAGYLWESAG